MNLEDACRAIDAEPWRGKLIEDSLAYAVRWADYISRRYPGKDFEPLVMSGLYIAAATWEPNGRGGFLRWFKKTKAWSSTANARRGRRTREAGYKRGGVRDRSIVPVSKPPPIQFSSLSVDVIDRHFVYRDEDTINDD